MPDRTPSPGPLWRRLLWFAGLWLAGVTAAAGVACLIRVWLAP
jgi:hypothetical protein